MYDIDLVRQRASSLIKRSCFYQAEQLYLALMKGLDTKITNDRDTYIQCLVGLADVYLALGGHHLNDAFEWQWSCMQAVTLLEEGIKLCNDGGIDNSASCHSQSLQEVNWKLKSARQCLLKALRDLLNQRDSFQTLVQNVDTKFAENRSRSGWLQPAASPDNSRAIQSPMSTDTSLSYTPTRHTPSTPIHQTPTESVQPNSLIEDINYQRMLMKFSTPTAMKYGINGLHTHSSLNTRSLGQRRSSDSCLALPYMERRASLALPMERRGSAVIPERRLSLASSQRRLSAVVSRRPLHYEESSTELELLEGSKAVRPNSLALDSQRAAMSSRVEKVVEQLRTKVSNMQRRNSAQSPVVNWQTAIKQHKSMIAEALDDLSVESNSTGEDQSSEQCSELSAYTDSFGETTTTSLEIQTESVTVRSEYYLGHTQVLDNSHLAGIVTRSSPLYQHTNGRQENGSDQLNGLVEEESENEFQPEAHEKPRTLDLTTPVKRRSFHLLKFEAVSPVTENCTFSFGDPLDESRTKAVVLSSPLCPITQQNVYHTLAHALVELADQKFDEDAFPEASMLYEQALSILNKIYESTGYHNQQMVHILKRCGLIRMKKRDVLGAIGLFDHAMDVMTSHCGTGDHLEIAELWYEKGNAMIQDGDHTETVRCSVISILRDQETNEVLDAPLEDDEDSDNHNLRTVEHTYPINAFEAIACYQKARNIMQTIDADKGQLPAQVLMKLGDCSLLVGDLDVATMFYEMSLACFDSSSVPSSLCDNAHVLFMLGFVLHVKKIYSKANVTFQCAAIMYHRIENTTDQCESFDSACVKALLCFTNFATGKLTKAVSDGVTAYTVFTSLYGDGICSLNVHYFWLVLQTLFSVARSYYALRLYDRSLEYLAIAKQYCDSAGPNVDRVLLVRILELTGVCYEATNSADEAYALYSSAIDENRRNSEIGYTSSAIESELLSKAAGIHVSMQQYNEASTCLEQARSASQSMREGIHSDMIALLHQLGQTHTLANHVERAIECYNECIELYTEQHDELGVEMAATLGNLAEMYHVMAQTRQTVEGVEKYVFLAEKCFKQAMDLEFTPSLAFRYVNFLFGQKSFVEAILILQHLLHLDELDVEDLTFQGVEKHTAPDVLVYDFLDDVIVIRPDVFIRYALVVSHKGLGHMDSAEYYIMDLIELCYDWERTATCSFLLAYALMEFELYLEAAACFEDSTVEQALESASVTAWICVACEVYRTLMTGLRNMCRKMRLVGKPRVKLV